MVQDLEDLEREQGEERAKPSTIPRPAAHARFGKSGVRVMWRKERARRRRRRRRRGPLDDGGGGVMALRLIGFSLAAGSGGEGEDPE
jgi:hypothetical protein